MLQRGRRPRSRSGDASNAREQPRPVSVSSVSVVARGVHGRPPPNAPPDAHRRPAAHPSFQSHESKGKETARVTQHSAPHQFDDGSPETIELAAYAAVYRTITEALGERDPTNFSSRFAWTMRCVDECRLPETGDFDPGKAADVVMSLSSLLMGLVELVDDPVESIQQLVAHVLATQVQMFESDGPLPMVTVDRATIEALCELDIDLQESTVSSAEGALERLRHEIKIAQDLRSVDDPGFIERLVSGRDAG